MSGEQEQFLQAIVDDPRNDLPRLIYADWLEEQGDLRGEFIRVQCELVNAGEERAKALKEREVELVRAHGKEWRQPFFDSMIRANGPNPRRSTIKISCNTTYFDRGFIKPSLVSTLQNFAEYGHEISKVAPLVTLNINARQDDDRHVKAFAEAPHLNTVQRLYMAGGSLAPVMGILASSPNFTHLHKLLLPRNRIGDYGAAALAEGKGLTSLKELELGTNQIHYRGVKKILETENLPNLVSLDLSNDISILFERNRLGTKEKVEPIVSRHLTKLQSLDFVGCSITGRQIRPLLHHCHFPNLKKLLLSDNDLGPEGMRELADCSLLEGLESLHLSSCMLGERGAEILAGCDKLRELRKLYIGGNRMTRAGVQALLDSENLAGLEVLYIPASGMEVGQPLRFTKNQSELRELQLVNNVINDADILSLASCEYLKKLKELSLEETDVGDEGIRALAESKHLEGLKKLHLARCTQISDEGIRILSDWRDRRAAEGNPIDIDGIYLRPPPRTETEVSEVAENQATPERGDGHCG